MLSCTLQTLCVQDKVQRVSNLLEEGSKRWLSDPQDRSGQVEAVFQLEQPCRLAFLDIGQCSEGMHTITGRISISITITVLVLLLVLLLVLEYCLPQVPSKYEFDSKLCNS